MKEASVPHDDIAEESLIGAMLLSPGAALVAVETCNANDMYTPRNKRIFAAIADLIDQGIEPDPVTISSTLNDPDSLDVMVAMMTGTASAQYVSNYATIVKRDSASRQMMHRMAEAIQMLGAGTDPYGEAADVEKFLNNIETGTLNNEPIAQTISELAASEDATSDIIIPGLMKRDYRTIVTAGEGGGKSVLLRVIAMAAAQGRHPFTHAIQPPVRSLVIDLENPLEAILETAVKFDAMLKTRDPDTYDEERFRVARFPGGLNIRKLADRAEIEREIAFHKPDLLCMGPLYKMYHKEKGEAYEDAAEEMLQILDRLRTKHHFALMLEHHAAKGKNGEQRDLNPMGSQRLLAWPEAVIAMRPRRDDPHVLDIERPGRLDRVAGISWPTYLIRDRDWLIKGIWA